MNTHIHTVDVLIVGAGLAGTSAAIEVAKKWSVTVLTKLYPTRSHSSAAQGGIAAALGNEEEDKPEWHTFDTVKGSDYLGDQEEIEVMTQDAPRVVYNLEHMGVPFNRTEKGLIAQRNFGGHTREFGKAPVKRACYSADRTGHSLLSALYEQALKNKVKFCSEFHVLAIDVQERKCRGVVAVELATGDIHVFQAKITMLATGGYGRVYKTTSNALASTGDCISLIYGCGIPLMDMEFFQFHPTGLYGLGILVTEGARGEGGILLNRSGERFMEYYAPTIKDLAPRDMVSRAIITEVQEGRGINGRDYVYLDLRHLGKSKIEDRLPEISRFSQIYMGIDPSEAPIPVQPTAHYAMGGIPTDIDGRVYADEQGSTIEGLFSAGECACVSVHGANRLGCNSLLDTVVFGTRAGKAMAQIVEDVDLKPISKDFVDSTISSYDSFKGRKGTESVGAIRKRLQEVMMDKCSVFRIEKGLTSLLQDLELLKRWYQDIGVTDKGNIFNTEVLEAIELGHLIQLSFLITASALERTESRGAHYREDFPARDDKKWLKHTLAFKDRENVAFRYKPVTITRFEPMERKY